MDNKTEEDVVMERPMHLFRPIENHSKLEIVPETLEILSKIKKPVVIVTVVGTQRGGKSTLLNLLHSRKTSGFGLGHYLDAQTTGLWIWVRPHPRNPDIQVILMDTEGLDSPHIPQWYNWTLSAVALLISGYFIYQTKGSIDSSAVDRLGVILKVAEQLRGSQDANTDKPYFMWLIRDHQLAMKKGPRQEMIEKLDQGAQKALDKCFADYDCFPLPRPVDRDELLKEVDNMTWDQLKSEFREEYVVLERQIFNTITRERKLSSRVVTGEVIASLLGKYSAAISSRDGILTELSQLPTQRQMIVKMAGERAVKEAIVTYKSAMQSTVESLPVDDVTLSTAHVKAYESSILAFKRETQTDEKSKIDAELEEFLSEFDKQIANFVEVTTISAGSVVVVKKLVSGLYYQYINDNIRLSKERCQSEIDSIYSSIIGDKVKNGSYEFLQNFLDDLQTVRKQFKASPKAIGSAKQEVESEFFSLKKSESELVNISILRREFSKQLETRLSDLMKKQNQDLEKNIREQSENFNSKIGVLSDSLKNFSSETTGYINSIRNSISEIEKTHSEKIASVLEAVHKLEVPVALHTQGINTLTPKVETLQGEIKAIPVIQSRLEMTEGNFNNRFVTLEKSVSDVQSSTLAKISDIKEKLEENINQVSENLRKSEISEKEKTDSLQKSIDANSLKIENSSKEISSFKENINSQISSVNQRIDSEVSKTNEKISSLDSKVSETSKQLDQNLQTFKSQTQHEIEGINKEWKESVSESSKKIQEKLEESSSQLKSEIGDTNQRFSKLGESLSLLEKNSLENSKSLTEMVQNSLKQVDEKSNSSIEKLKQEVHSQIGEFSEKNSHQVSELSSQVKTLTSSLENSVKNSLNEFKEKSQSEFESFSKEIRQNQISALEASSKQVKETIEEFKSEMESLKSNLQSSLTQSSSEISAKIQQVDSQFDSIKKENEKALEDIKLKLQSVAKQLDDLVDAKMKSLNQVLENSKSELDLKVQKIEGEVQEFSSVLENIRKSSDVTSVANRLQIVEEKFTEIGNTIGDSEKRNSQQILQSNARITELSTKLESGISDIEKLVNSSSATQQSKLEETVKNLKSQLENFTRELETKSSVPEKQLKEFAQRLETRVNNTQQDITQIRELLGNNETTSKSIEHVKSSIDAVWNSVGMLSGRIAEMEATIDLHR